MSPKKRSRAKTKVDLLKYMDSNFKLSSKSKRKVVSPVKFKDSEEIETKKFSIKEEEK